MREGAMERSFSSHLHRKLDKKCKLIFTTEFMHCAIAALRSLLLR